MSEIAISRRYAQALNEQALAAGALDRVDADISFISEGLSASRDLVGIFSSPIVSREKKADIFRSLFGDKVDKLTLSFLVLLVEKRRENLFPDMVTAYRALRDEQMGVVSVTARTALSLSADEQTALVASLKKLTGKNVRLETRIDPSILGGIVIRVGDTVYDASVANQLATLRVRLETGSLA